MTRSSARIWIIEASLVAYAISFVFFVLAPALGYPLGYADSIDVLKVILPVFAGYLGAAVLFLLANPATARNEKPNKMLGLLVRGPVIIFGVGMLALLVAFYLSNKSEFDGSGMTPKTLSLFVSLLAALLAATTGAISSALLFKLEGPESAAAKQSDLLSQATLDRESKS